MKVKICGVTTPADARLAVDLGADFIGLNFYRPSPRWIDVDQAAHIRRGIGDRARTVGIFVDPTRDELEAIDRKVGLDYIQFSGDESPELVAEFSERAIRVRRVGGAAAPSALRAARGGGRAAFERPCIPPSVVAPRSSMARYAPSSRLAGRAPDRSRCDTDLHHGLLDEDCWAILIDRAHESLYGGSGESWDYAAAADLVRTPAGSGEPRRLFLAGGVRPCNVAEVAAAVPGAYAVDTCSGVESAPGRKDRAKLEQLFANLRTGAAR